MSTVREILFDVLKNDAKDATSGHLGYLLGQTGTDPYGIYFLSPPKSPVFPAVIFYESGSTGLFPEIIMVNFTIWGGAFDLIERRLFDLLHKQQINFQLATNMYVAQIWWDWSGPDIFDVNYEVYAKSMRFLIRGVKK